MTKIKIPFVHVVLSRGKLYYYFRKPGCARIRLPGPPGGEAFNAAYSAACSANAPRSDIGQDRNQLGSVAALVAAYANSAHFKHELADVTRGSQWPILQRFRDQHGHKPVAKLRREHVLNLIGKLEPYPRRNWLKAVRPMLQFAIEIGMITADPTAGIKVKLPKKGEGFRTWGEAEIATFRRHYPLGSRERLALELLLGSVQRRSDVVRLGPQHVRDGLLYVRQSKTGASLALPILPELKEALAVAARGHLTFLTTPRGQPFSPHNFGNWFRRACAEAGLRGYSAHGLRKAGCRRLAEAGCSASEISAWSGHRTLSEVGRYTRAADQLAMAKAAAAKLRTSVENTAGPECKTFAKSKRKQRPTP